MQLKVFDFEKKNYTLEEAKELIRQELAVNPELEKELRTIQTEIPEWAGNFDEVKLRFVFYLLVSKGDVEVALEKTWNFFGNCRVFSHILGGVGK